MGTMKFLVWNLFRPRPVGTIEANDAQQAMEAARREFGHRTPDRIFVTDPDGGRAGTQHKLEE